MTFVLVLKSVSVYWVVKMDRRHFLTIDMSLSAKPTTFPRISNLAKVRLLIWAWLLIFIAVQVSSMIVAQTASFAVV